MAPKKEMKETKVGKSKKIKLGPISSGAKNVSLTSGRVNIKDLTPPHPMN
jgi:hypothetical protein